jgi:hypothetical protein
VGQRSQGETKEETQEGQVVPTGQTPEVQFKGLPYGDNQDINDQLDAVPDFAMADQGEPPPDQQEGPSTPETDFLFGPSDRPDEPITAGVPVGPGPDVTRRLYETDEQFLGRVARTLVSAPGADRSLQAFAKKVERGL